MTRTHRVLNRLVLALVALVLFALAGVAALSLMPSALRPVSAARIADALTTTPGLVAIVVAAVGITVAAAVWIASRGRGRARDVIGQGDIAVDDRVVEALLRDGLTEQSSVLGVHAHAYRQGRRVVYARIDVRRSADLPALLDDVARATDRTADRLGARPPFVVHLTSGLVARASRTRIAR